MVGLVVATHGRLATELVATAEQIVGKLENTTTCLVEAGSSPEEIHRRICAAVDAVENGDGVLVLADMLGGTPCNQCLQLSAARHLEVVTGANLPLLLKANSLRSQPLGLSEMAAILTQHGQRNIANATALLREQGSRTAH